MVSVVTNLYLLLKKKNDDFCSDLEFVIEAITVNNEIV